MFWHPFYTFTDDAGYVPPVVVPTATVTPAGEGGGRKRKRTVLIGDKTYKVNSLRDVEFLLKRLVRQGAVEVPKPVKARKKVVDRVTADVVAEAPVAVPMASVEVDWTPLIQQLEAQDRAYAEVLLKVLARQEEDDIETLLLLIH